MRCSVLALAMLSMSVAAGAQTDPTVASVREAEKVMAAGDIAGGIATLEKIVAVSPGSFEARLALGRAFDLDGRHRPARQQLEEAVRVARDEQRRSALLSLGTSYAFESKADEAARYYQRAFDADMQSDDRSAAAGVANALGRVYLESGNLKKADEWYTTGYETARKIPGLPEADRTLWEMRRHNALGRIAARRGDKAAAERHAAEVKALLDRGLNDNQRAFYPYLLGYIAFFAKDYQRAIDELMKGDANDPFVVGLIAQAYEKRGQRELAAEYYRKVLALASHSINSAFARPLARKFLR